MIFDCNSLQVERNLLRLHGRRLFPQNCRSQAAVQSVAASTLIRPLRIIGDRLRLRLLLLLTCQMVRAVLVCRRSRVLVAVNAALETPGNPEHQLLTLQRRQ